jgi:hypothetical protein
MNVASREQIAVWKEMIAEYESWYKGQYGCRPGNKCMDSFCKLNNIPQPLPEPDDEFDFLQ